MIPIRAAKLDRGIRIAALIALILVACLNLGSAIAQALPYWDRAVDDVSQHVQRVLPMRDMLPANGEVGYLSDIDPGDVNLVPEADRDYYLTQYALAPLVVIRTTDRDIVVGNFRQLPTRALPDGVVQVRNFGGGVMLLKRRVE